MNKRYEIISMTGTDCTGHANDRYMLDVLLHLLWIKIQLRQQTKEKTDYGSVCLCEKVDNNNI